MTKKRVFFTVSFILLEDATPDRAAGYIEEAVGSWYGSLQPPNPYGDDPDDEGDPMFGLDYKTVKVTKQRRKI